MNRQKIVQWIRKNDEIYSEVNLSIFNDEELHFLRREIIYYKKMHRIKDFIITWEKGGHFSENPFL